MELIGIIALGILRVIGAAASKIMADEFKAWLPTVINHLIGWASSSLPEDKREDYVREWRSDIDGTPGDIWKLLFALDLVRAAMKLSRFFKQEARETEEVIAQTQRVEAHLVDMLVDLTHAREGLRGEIESLARGAEWARAKTHRVLSTFKKWKSARVRVMPICARIALICRSGF